MNKPIHILRYGTAGDKTHLEKARTAFDYLAINANSAAHVSGAIAKFVVEELFDGKRGYFIDPITYAFQKNIRLLLNKDQKIKKSIQKLIDAYGKPTTNILSDNPIQLSDFSDEKDLVEFCKKVLDFEYKIIRQSIDQEDMAKYLEFDTDVSMDHIASLHPKFLIAPYFYLDEADPDFEGWLDINIKCISESKRMGLEYNNTKVFAQIVISQESLLNAEAMEKIADQYSKCNCDGITIWIDNLNEHDSSEELLTRFCEMLKTLNAKPIYNMYGGFFSILLTHKTLNLINGVSHGLEYGESRAVYPVGGGIPVSKYYFMPLHQRTDFTKAFYLLEHNNVIDTAKPDWGSVEKYFAEICRCSQCKKILKSAMIDFIQFESDQFYTITRKNGNVIRRKKASAETKRNCLYHYLLCKKKEFDLVKNERDILNILTCLKNEKAKYEECSSIDEQDLEYITIWERVVQHTLQRI